MTIKSLATKLRKAADVLEELLSGEISIMNETTEAAGKLRRAMKKSRKNGKRNGKHWTKTVKGRKLLAERKRARLKKGATE